MKKAIVLFLMVVNVLLALLISHKDEKKLPPKEHKNPWVEKMHAYEIDTTGYDEIYFLVYGLTPFFYLNGEQAGTLAWGPVVGKKECKKVYFVERIHAKEHRLEKDLFVLEYVPADGVTTDPRLTQKWIRELVRSMRKGYIFNLTKWVEDATGSSHYDDDEYKPYGWKKLVDFRSKIVSEIEKTPGASLLEKALRYTKKVVPRKKN